MQTFSVGETEVQTFFRRGMCNVGVLRGGCYLGGGIPAENTFVRYMVTSVTHFIHHAPIGEFFDRIGWEITVSSIRKTCIRNMVRIPPPALIFFVTLTAPPGNN